MDGRAPSLRNISVQAVLYLAQRAATGSASPAAACRSASSLHEFTVGCCGGGGRTKGSGAVASNNKHKPWNHSNGGRNTASHELARHGSQTWKCWAFIRGGETQSTHQPSPGLSSPPPPPPRNSLPLRLCLCLCLCLSPDPIPQGWHSPITIIASIAQSIVLSCFIPPHPAISRLGLLDQGPYLAQGPTA